MKKFLVSLVSIFSVLVTLAGIIVALSALLKNRKEKCCCKDEDESFDYHDDLNELDDDFDTEYYTVHSEENSSSASDASKAESNDTSHEEINSAPASQEVKTDLDDLLEDFDEEEGSIRF